MRIPFTKVKAGLAVVAVTMIYVGVSGLMADPEKVEITWGHACDDSRCTPAAMLVGRVPDEQALVIDVLQSRPQVVTLCLQSQEGSSGGAMALANWLSKHGYNTCVPRASSQRAICAGACTVIFAGGKQRTAFGIHGRAVSGLLRKRPNALTGESGIPAGSNAWQRQASVQANQWVSRLGQAIRFGAYAAPMAKLLGEAALVPAHTIKLLTPEQLANWKLTNKPNDKKLVWLPEKPHRGGRAHDRSARAGPARD